MTWIEIAWRVALYAGAIPLTGFIVSYATRSRWTATDVGRIIMGLAVSLDAVMVIGLSNLVWGEWPGLHTTRLLAYTAVTGALCHLYVTLRRIQRTRDDGTLDPPFPAVLFQRRPRRKDPS